MKKRPQQCQRQGKSNTNIKSFINNLKENDLHFEDNQITQCVFLGVLRLKPVPSVFSSNNVPCLVVENKSKKPKNNNNTKEVNKNVSRKKDINKVISGRIGKKNTDKIRASVKKEPLKKAAIKLKFSMNNKDTTSKDSQESVRILPESLTKITSESVLTNRTITLNPITNVPTFNPVQNLFDKLKQQLDDSFNRPSCSSEVNKQTLFSDKSNTDIHLSSKKQKKGINRRDISKISSVSTFSDNGYHPNSSLNSKLTQDIFLLTEDNATEDCEVLLNSGPMPNFVLDTSTQKIDNDVILITDDNSDISSASKELIVVDDVKCVRSSPRLNRNEQRNTQQKITAIPETIINLDDGESSDKEKMAPKINVEKPKKRRTLMPSAIPSIFFNTPRLLRSELGQKKGSFSETKTVAKNSTTKIQKPENKLDKLPVKQRKDPKLKNSTENIIYEVVKSTENIRFFADVVTNSQDDIVLIESSPPKVEPLILKLKKSTEKTADQNAIEDIRNKEKSQKMYTKNVTRNLFFPRLLRSDINQPKDNKTESTKKSIKAIEIGIQKTSQAKNEKYVPSASIGRISVKPTEQLIEKSPQQEEHCRNPVQKVTEKNIGGRDTGKKNEKSLPTPSKMLGSQVQNASNIITIEDSDSTNLTDIFSQNIGKSKNIDNTSNDLQNQRQLRSDDSQNKGNESTIEKSKKNIPKTSTITDNIEIIDIEFQSNTKTTPIKKQELKNTVQEQSHVRQLRSDSPHKKANNSKPVDIEELNKNNGKSKKHSPKTGNDTVENTVPSPMKSENKECNLESIDVDRHCKVDVTPTATKTKNIAVVQPMSRQSKVELPQKKITEMKIINDIQNQNITSLEEVTKSPTKHIVTDISISTKLESQPTYENTTALATVAVGRFYSNDATPQTGVSLQERRQLRSDDTVDKNTKTENLELNKFKADMDKLKIIDKTVRNDSNKLEKTKMISSKDKTKDTLDIGTVQQKTEFQKQIDSPISKSTEQSDPKILRSSTFSMESKNSSNQVVESKVKAVGAQEALIDKKSIASDKNIQQEPNTGVKSKLILESEDNTKKTIKKYGRNILKCKTNSPSRQKKVITKKSIKKPSKSITFKTITTEVIDSADFINKEVSKSDGTSTSKKPIVKKIVQTFKKLASKKQLLKPTNLLTKKQSLKLKKKQTADSQITSQSSLIVYSARTPPKAISGTSDSSQTIIKTLETPQKDTNIKIMSDVQSNIVLDTKNQNLKTKDFSSEVKTQKTNVPKSDPSKSEKKIEAIVSNRNIPNTRPSTLNISQEQSEDLDQTKAHFAISSSKSGSKLQTKTKHKKSSLVTLQKKDKMKQKMNLKIYKKKLTRNLLRSIKKPAKVAPTADLKIISQSNIILNSRRSISKSKAPEETFKASQKEFDDSEVIKPTGPSTESKVSTNESEDNPVDENGVTGNDIKNKHIKKQKLLSIKKTVGSKIAANIKRTSIKLQNKKHNIEMKRKRGRPRIYPAEIKLDKTLTSGIKLQVSTEEVTLDKADNAVLEKTGEVKRKVGRPKKQQGEAVLEKEQLIAATGENGLNDTMYGQIPNSAENRQVSTEEVTLDKADNAVLEKTGEVKRKVGRPKKQQGEAVLEKEQLIAATGEKGLNDTMYGQIPNSAESRQTSTEEVPLDKADNAVLEKTGEVKRKVGRPKKQQGEAVLEKEQLIAATGEKSPNDSMSAESKKQKVAMKQIKEEIISDLNEKPQLNEDCLKKMRGKSKKLLQDVTLDETQVSLVEKEENSDYETKSQQTNERDSIKKKRGRPKKQQLDIIIDKENSNEEHTETQLKETDNTKKPRSGPKNISLDNALTKTLVTEILLKEEITDNENREELNKTYNSTNQPIEISVLDNTQVEAFGDENKIMNSSEIDIVKKKRGRPKKQTEITLDNTQVEFTNVQKIVNNKNSTKISVLVKKQDQTEDILNDTKNSDIQIQTLEISNIKNTKHANAENIIVESIENEKIKRKPGRPKKVKVGDSLDQTTVLEVQSCQGITNDKNEVSQSTEFLDKEKNKLDNLITNTNKSNKDQTTVICAEVKKKRGRPSKLPTELKLDLAEADQEQKTKKPKMSGMEINNLQIDLKVSEKTTDKNTVNKKKPLQKTQEDLDIIMIVPEKRNKKQINTPLKTLRSSVNQTEKERTVNIAQPIVEKVVALIHSEPRPKQHSDASEITSNHIEDTKESKTRVLRSQNVNEIDSINEVKEGTKKSRLAKEHKIAKKKKGVSEKSKNIIKNKTKLSKTIAGNKEATKKKIVKTDVIDKSKLKKMSNKSKQKVLKQITKKLQNSKNKNILKRPSRTKKSSSFNKKRSVNWDNNDIIERIIQEIRNTLFKEESKIIRKKIKQKKITLKTQKKKNTKPERIKREAFLAAKKKMMQTKAALKQKLRNAKNDENTSGGSESKENHPPKKEMEQLEEEKNDRKNEEVLVVTTQEDDIMIKDETSFQSDVTNQTNKTNKRKKPESVDRKRRSYRSTLVSRHMAAMAAGDDKEDENIDFKKNDITVFDFDESEPEVTPLRHKSVTKLNDLDTPLSESRHKKTSKVELKSSTPINSHATSNSQKSLTHGSSKKPGPATSVTENEVIEIPESSVSLIEQKPSDSQGHSSKIKILKQDRLYSEILVYPDEEEEIPKDKFVSIEKENPVNAEKEYSSPEVNEMPRQELVSKRRKLLVPYIDDHGKPKKLWSVIETPCVPDTPPRPITPRQALSSPRSERRSDSLEMFKPSTSAVKPAESDSPQEKKSPLKQPTIIEMFSKVWMKKELPTKNLSEDNNFKTEESIFQRPITPDVNVTAPSPRRDRGDDEDSDTESRAEWIPEEYAEYKFKYSASRMMQYKPIFKCKICMMVVPSYYKLLKHRKEHENNDKPYKCPQCSTNFSNVDDFSAHLRLHKGKHPYMCPKCDLGFWTKSAYEAHQPVHILKKAKQPIKKFRCDVCAKEFSKLCDVERHTRVHTGEKPCICNICNKRFQQAHNLSKHLMTHLHIKPFYCEICNKKFGRNDVLRRHLLTHSIDKPVKCSVCYRGFIRHSQLLQHMRRKHPRHPVDVSESYADPNESESSETKDDGFDNEPSTSKFKNNSHDK
ncbi:uncharacterized protein [Diabrotica undecimpunctata]|uniref:uncharacterized protein n=1 Tax=Diabrotica undecimpunctata TaxID=50387 RepID=UPI003B637115